MISFGTEPGYYAGVGSRDSPAVVRAVMTRASGALERLGWVLRSGGADGADMAFEAGVLDHSRKEIYLPWRAFNNNPSPLHVVTDEALHTARNFHPAWHNLRPAGQKLMARNTYQVLGGDMKTHSRFVLCYTEGGMGGGGTGQAIRVAHAYGIPVYDMGTPGVTEAVREALCI